MDLSIQPTFAQAPFDNPAGDIILRSSDGVHFRVRSAILAEASPVFNDMLAFPQPPEVAQDCTDTTDGSSSAVPSALDGKPVVQLSEESEALDPLLRLCYPTKDPELTGLREIRLVLGAALKYDMEEAASLMKEALCAHIETQPLRTWASACLLRLEDEARVAATALLGKDLPPDVPPELNEVSAGDYYRLETFRRAGGNVPGAFKFSEPNPTDVELSPPVSGRPPRASRRGEDAVFEYEATRPYADIICRSTDGREFPTHRIILALASPVLAAHIAQQHPGRVAPDDPLPILELDADGDAVSAALELCYARTRTAVPHLSALGLPRTLGAAVLARRCAMDGVLESLRYQAFWHAYAPRPLAAYLSAARAGFTDWAADVLPSLRGDLFAHGYVPEMESTPAAVYHRLMINRRKSIVATARLTGTPTPLTPGSVPASPAASPRPKRESVQKAIEGDPWLLAMSRQTAEGLTQAAAGTEGERSIYRYDPNLKKLLRESISRKIWCSRCEPNVRLMLSMKEMYDQVTSAAWQHDVSVSTYSPEPLLTPSGFMITAR